MARIPAFMQPQQPIAFAEPGRTSVAKHRYLKDIKEKDTDKAIGGYAKSAGAGALLGMALRKGGVRRRVGAGIGAVGGLVAQGAVRAGTARTKDQFGDRSHGGKITDKLVAPALLGGAVIAASPRLRKKLASARAAAKTGLKSAAKHGPKFAGEVMREVGRGIVGLGAKFSREALLHGAALAGGITVADVATHAAMAKKGERAKAAKKGAVQGAIYGTTLAAAEPLIMAGLRRAKLPKRIVPSRAIVPLSARVKANAFARGRYSNRITGHMIVPSRGTPAAKAAAGTVRVYRSKPITTQVEETARTARKEGRKKYGKDSLAVLTQQGDVHGFPGGKVRAQVLDNLDVQAARHGREAYDVVRNGNNIPLVREQRRLPGYHLLSRRGRTIAFRGAQQLYTDDHPTAKRVFADPLKVASGEQRGYTVDQHGNQQNADYGIRHAQVIKAAMNKGRGAYKWGSRAGRTASDVKDTVTGKRKVDERGRPLKREWEKSYFKNAVGSAAVAGGLLLHARQMRLNPKYRSRVKTATSAVKERANKIVPDLFPLSARKGRPIAFARTARGIVAFDMTAPEWDVRDQRGRSARVFAPGARRRERREKHWHERTDNLRRLAVVGVLAAGAGAGTLGYKIGKRKRVAPFIPKPSAVHGSNEVPFPRAG